MEKILIADDEKKIREDIYTYLTAKGMDVMLARNGQEAVELCREESFDLLILDVMMPVMDGLQACREIRLFSDVPILFLSALGDEPDYINGYRSGADDYVVKPIMLSVLHRKVKSMIRRYRGTDGNMLIRGCICLNLDTGQVLAGGQEIHLPTRDYELLKFLLQNERRLLSRSQIIEKVWTYDFDGDERVVDTHIKRLRKALGQYAGCIHTKPGMGYYFESDKE